MAWARWWGVGDRQCRQGLPQEGCLEMVGSRQHGGWRWCRQGWPRDGVRVAHGYGMGMEGPTRIRTHETCTRTGTGTTPYPKHHSVHKTPQVHCKPIWVCYFFFHLGMPCAVFLFLSFVFDMY